MARKPADAAPRETVLVVEDDLAIRTGLELNLRLEGYRVLCAGDVRTALTLALREEPALLLLDLMLPDGSGLDVLRALRTAGRELPVIILSALGQESDVVCGLQQGADDYVTKPFAVAELLARVDAALRRSRIDRGRETPITAGDLTIDRERREVLCDGERLRLTPREYEMLLLLAEHPGRVYTREQLLQLLWGDDYEGTSRTVDNFVCSLRGKLEQDPSRPRQIVTVHGVGYRFEVEP